jgi:hypothetical protein
MNNSYIIISAIILLGFLVLKEIRRKNKANLILRLTAICLAVIALIFIAIPITYQKKTDFKEENAAALITAGIQKDSLEKFKTIAAFTTNPDIAKDFKSVKLIPDLESFLAMNQQYSRFHVLGYGLQAQELEMMEGKELLFHPSQLPLGLRTIHWNKALYSGEQLTLSGNFLNAAKKPIKLILRGMGTNLDSVIIPGGRSENFQLKTIPKHLDKAVYALIGIAEKDTILNEKVPVFVLNRNPIKVLILSSSPGFENKFLKNWLFENDYSIAVRSAISKNKFSTEFLNNTRINLDRISPSVLENFDLLISDPEELSALSQTENQSIQNQIINGMGLILIADSIRKAPGFIKGLFETRAIVRSEEKILNMNWDDFKAKKINSGSSALFRILPKEGNMPLVRDDQSNILVSSQLLGKGRILLSSINDTYTWILGNDLKSYSSYWSKLFGNVARMKELSSVWVLKDPLPVLNQETSIILESGSDSIPVASSETELLKFAQDPILGFQWAAPFWPKKTGWNLLETGIPPNSIQSWFYVFNKNDWATVNDTEKIKNNRKMSVESFTESIAQNSSDRYYPEVIPPIFFYLLFLLSCTYLWLEAKKF